tara:strand:+ start:1327 stop:1539 length:213 start_codon:yes stop_codon:yes gene_type:complete
MSWYGNLEGVGDLSREDQKILKGTNSRLTLITVVIMLGGALLLFNEIAPPRTITTTQQEGLLSRVTGGAL